MGYDFYVSAVTIAPARNGKLLLRVELVNRGVAPFYYDWRTEFGLIGSRWPDDEDVGGFGEDHRLAAWRRPQNLGRGARCGAACSRQVQARHASAEQALERPSAPVCQQDPGCRCAGLAYARPDPSPMTPQVLAGGGFGFPSPIRFPYAPAS